MEKGITKNEIITLLTKTAHAGGVGKRKKGEKAPKLTPDQRKDQQNAVLAEAYGKVGNAALAEDPNFFAHLVAWNFQKGSVRDAKVALPAIALASTDPEHLDNALAHLAALRPREFARAIQFSRTVAAPRNVVRRLVKRWLTAIELLHPKAWESLALRHHKVLKGLYGRYHIKPGARAQEVLFKSNYSSTPKFAALAGLSAMEPLAIAGAIRAHQLPFLSVRGALGGKLKDVDVLCAVIGAMTTNELVTNMKALEKLGVKDNAASRAALAKALEKPIKGGAVVLKAAVAAEAQDDEVLGQKLHALQEKALEQQVKGIEGDWLVAVDKSYSMQGAIEVGKGIGAMLARLVKGKVQLAFFNTTPTFYDISSKTLEEITKLTRHETASGGTLIGTPLQALADRKQPVDGIVVVSDGGDNVPGGFAAAYKRYVAALGNEPTVYFFKLAGDPDRLSDTLGEGEIQVFDLRGGIDYTSLPNLVQTMRVGRFSLLDEVMATPLRTLDEVLKRETSLV